MDGPTSLTDLATTSKSNFARPALLALPTEIIDKIFSFVDNSGLVNLRLVSRSVCAIANRPFAVKNFASSHHVVSRESFETLLAVSAHSFFGAYIKSIMIGPYRKVLDRLRFDDVANLKMYKLVTKFLKSRDSPIDLHFTWDDKGLLEYNHLRGHLCFSASSILLNRAHPDVLFVEGIVRLLADTSFSNLHLQQLDVDCLPNLEAYFTQSLQTITLEDIRLNSTLFAPGLYSNLFQRLSELPDLRHCKFNMLHYSLQYADEIVPPLAIQFSSRYYRSAWESLLLIFPDGKPKVEIQGADIPRQLEDLAAYTAAAEKRKVHEVEAAGELVDRRVMGADVSTIGKEEDFGRPVSLRIPVVPAPPFVWPTW
jgi:hypothetical protein